MSAAADEWEAARYAEHRLRERLAPHARSRGTALGTVLALLVGVGAWIAGAVWPESSPAPIEDGTAVVLADGGIYVLEAGILYPAANLASARLAAERVEHRDAVDLARFRIGATRGIPGALTALPDPEALLPADWQLCSGGDGPQTLTVGAAAYLPPPSGDSTLITDGSGTWLVSGGSRVPVDEAAGADPAAAVPVSPTLASLLPESSALPPGSSGAPSTPPGVVCVQSDPAAPFARPAAAAVARNAQHPAPSNHGTRVVLPVGGGLLAHQRDGSGYWLLSYSAELAPIEDDAALARLGYRPSQAVDVPGELIALLTPGPELGIDAARTPVDALG